MFLSRFFLFGREKIVPEVDHIIVGLGNPGKAYAGTRHSTGFEVIDACKRAMRITRRMRVCRSHITEGIADNGAKVTLVKPQTFMNLSGEAISAVVRRYGRKIDKCLVIVDDFHLNAGVIRFRRGGSDGGHNGLKSIIVVCGADFPRLRVGIGPVPGGMPTIDFVLGCFDKNDSALIKTAIGKAAEAVGFYIAQGMDAAMNRYNRTE